MPIKWIQYPKSTAPTLLSQSVVTVFESAMSQIESPDNRLKSNEVLDILAPGLQDLGFIVETGKRNSEKIHVPVLFGANGSVDKSFEADAFHAEAGFVLEVEAGRAVVNNQFLKDLFQACMMHDVEYLGIAVRNLYEGGSAKSRDFERVMAFLDTLYASNRLELPLRGILLIGY